MVSKETQELVNSMLAKVISEARALGIPVSRHIDPNVIISGRATSKLGSCQKKMLGFEITLAKRVTEAGVYAISTVLAHEVLHTCRGCQNHGVTWKRYAMMMNRTYGYRIKTTVKSEDLGVVTESRYVVRCLRCGQEFSRQRMCSLVKYPGRYRCRCGGKLVRIK